MDEPKMPRRPEKEGTSEPKFRKALTADENRLWTSLLDFCASKKVHRGHVLQQVEATASHWLADAIRRTPGGVQAFFAARDRRSAALSASLRRPEWGRRRPDRHRPPGYVLCRSELDGESLPDALAVAANFAFGDRLDIRAIVFNYVSAHKEGSEARARLEAQLERLNDVRSRPLSYEAWAEAIRVPGFALGEEALEAVAAATGLSIRVHLRDPADATWKERIVGPESSRSLHLCQSLVGLGSVHHDGLLRPDASLAAPPFRVPADLRPAASEPIFDVDTLMRELGRVSRTEPLYSTDPEALSVTGRMDAELEELAKDHGGLSELLRALGCPTSYRLGQRPAHVPIQNLRVESAIPLVTSEGIDWAAYSESRPDPTPVFEEAADAACPLTSFHEKSSDRELWGALNSLAIRTSYDEPVAAPPESAVFDEEPPGSVDVVVTEEMVKRLLERRHRERVDAELWAALRALAVCSFDDGPIEEPPPEPGLHLFDLPLQAYLLDVFEETMRLVGKSAPEPPAAEIDEEQPEHDKEPRQPGNCKNCGNSLVNRECRGICRRLRNLSIPQPPHFPPELFEPTPLVSDRHILRPASSAAVWRVLSPLSLFAAAEADREVAHKEERRRNPAWAHLAPLAAFAAEESGGGEPKVEGSGNGPLDDATTTVIHSLVASPPPPPPPKPSRSPSPSPPHTPPPETSETNKPFRMRHYVVLVFDENDVGLEPNGGAWCAWIPGPFDESSESQMERVAGIFQPYVRRVLRGFFGRSADGHMLEDPAVLFLQAEDTDLLRRLHDWHTQLEQQSSRPISAAPSVQRLSAGASPPRPPKRKAAKAPKAAPPHRNRRSKREGALVVAESRCFEGVYTPAQLLYVAKREVSSNGGDEESRGLRRDEDESDAGIMPMRVRRMSEVKSGDQLLDESPSTTVALLAGKPPPSTRVRRVRIAESVQETEIIESTLNCLVINFWEGMSSVDNNYSYPPFLDPDNDEDEAVYRITNKNVIPVILTVTVSDPHWEVRLASGQETAIAKPGERVKATLLRRPHPMPPKGKEPIFKCFYTFRQTTSELTAITAAQLSSGGVADVVSQEHLLHGPDVWDDVPADSASEAHAQGRSAAIAADASPGQSSPAPAAVFPAQPRRKGPRPTARPLTAKGQRLRKAALTKKLSLNKFSDWSTFAPNVPASAARPLRIQQHFDAALNQRLLVAVGINIFRVDAQVIVNAANAHLTLAGAGGIMAALREADSGDADYHAKWIADHVADLPPTAAARARRQAPAAVKLRPGGAILVPLHLTPAILCAHVLAPECKREDQRAQAYTLMYRGVMSALEQAAEEGMTSVAVPLLGTGIFLNSGADHFDKAAKREELVSALFAAIRAALHAFPSLATVILVIHDAADVADVVRVGLAHFPLAAPEQLALGGIAGLLFREMRVPSGYATRSVRVPLFGLGPDARVAFAVAVPGLTVTADKGVLKPGFPGPSPTVLIPPMMPTGRFDGTVRVRVMRPGETPAAAFKLLTDRADPANKSAPIVVNVLPLTQKRTYNQISE